MFALGDSDDDDDDKPATTANLDEQIQQCLKAIEAEVRATDLVSCCHRRRCHLILSLRSTTCDCHIRAHAVSGRVAAI